MSVILRTAAVFCLLTATACNKDVASARPESCHFSEQDLIGGWSSPTEDSEVVEDDRRELDFEVANGERLVREYLHHRLMSEGTWTLAECRVTITFGGGFGEEFQLERDAKPILVENTDDPEGRVVYSKIADEAPN